MNIQGVYAYSFTETHPEHNHETTHFKWETPTTARIIIYEDQIPFLSKNLYVPIDQQNMESYRNSFLLP